jgi:hypothetical protein
LVRRPEGKRPLGRSRRRWKDNIKMDLREIEIDGANWIRLAHDRVKCRAFVGTVIEPSGSIKKAGHCLTSWVTISFSKNIMDYYYYYYYYNYYYYYYIY